MARRSNQPALYELIRSRGGLPPPNRPGGAAEPEHGTSAPAGAEAAGQAAGSGSTSGVVGGASSASARSESTPLAGRRLAMPSASGASTARTLRVPVGFLWIGAAVAVTALVLSYAAGFVAGRERAQRDRALEIEAQIAARGGGITDPLSAGASGAAGAELDGGSGRGAGREGAAGGPPARGDRTGGRGAQAAERGGAPGGVQDPRVPGMNYFVLAHASVEGAPGLVAFLRENGLDAVVVADDNGVLRKVIVLPGIADRAERSSPEIRQLESRIRAVGLKWKNRARGNRDFGDYYLERYGR